MTTDHTNQPSSDTESFADLFQQNDAKKKQRLEKGQRIDATVVSISNEILFLDVGDKSEGYIYKSEFLDQDGNLSVGVGDTLKVYFLSADKGEKLFTTKLGSGTVSIAHLEAAFEKGIPIEGQIEKEIKGGYEVKLPGNVRAFCPYSQLELHRNDNTDEYIGQKHAFMIMELTEKGRNIIVSKRALLEHEREQQREALQKTLQEGMTVSGTITSIRDFGAFVDIGGVDGLIPISEIGWGRVDDINEYLHVGQQVETVVISLDWDKQRIALSLKQTLADPWDAVAEKFSPGTCHTGTVSRLTNFGAFVTLEPGIDGLVHISKLGGGRKLNHPREVLETGQELEVRIEELDTKKKRVSLDLAANLTEGSQAREDGDYKTYIQQPTDRTVTAMGSLGELLQKELQKKKR